MTKEEEGLLHFSCNPSILEYFLSLFCICGDLMEELKTFALFPTRNTKPQVGTTHWLSQETVTITEYTIKNPLLGNSLNNTLACKNSTERFWLDI